MRQSTIRYSTLRDQRVVIAPLLEVIDPLGQLVVAEYGEEYPHLFRKCAEKPEAHGLSPLSAVAT